MASNAVRGSDLRKIGYPEGVVIRVALETLNRHFAGKSKTFKLQLMKRVFNQQNDYLNDERFRLLIRELKYKAGEFNQPVLAKATAPLTIYGAEDISATAINQMHTALKLPVSVAGAWLDPSGKRIQVPAG